MFTTVKVSNIKNLAQIYGEECLFGGMEKVKPCDTDYKSILSPGSFENNDLRVYSKLYQKLRENHINKKRNNLFL